MGVNVDEAGGDNPPARVDLLAPAAADLPDGSNAPGGNCDVALDEVAPAAIGNRAAADHQIIIGLSHCLTLPLRPHPSAARAGGNPATRTFALGRRALG